MAYNSAYTGAQVDAAVGAVRNKETTWDSKQNALSGTEDQLVGFNASGEAAAVPMPSAADVGARPATWTPSASEVGAAPASHVEVVGSSSGIGHVKSGGGITINEDGTMTLTSVDGGTF